MFKLATYFFIFALTTRHLLVSSREKEVHQHIPETETKPEKTEDPVQSILAKLVEVQSRLEAQASDMKTRLDASLLALGTTVKDQNTILQELLIKTGIGIGIGIGMEEKMLALHYKTKNQAAAFQTTILKKLSTINSKIIPPKFKLVGTRYFYIESNVKRTWNDAADACRQMGGNLATIRSEEESIALNAAIIDNYHWIGVYRNESQYLNLVTGKNTTFLKWKPVEPNYNGDCIYVYQKLMGDYSCVAKLYFICQAADDI
ncbi:accessory gland protein Acp29AB-like [Drosophila elegans]|uniref:accessory gland protein Acp29AB-like n=1 Tax=Drosophila elegans TaxID=30023 RepID=UPI001BC8448C|nr:accessory gland protein Acp29AB-like [Drosophila elegans]